MSAKPNFANHSPLGRTSACRHIDDLGDLCEVGLGVLLDLLGGQSLSARVAAAGVADRGRGGADDEHRGVAEFLELPQLAQRNRVAEVDVEAGGVDAVLDAQRLAGRDDCVRASS